MKRLMILALLALAGCASPQERYAELERKAAEMYPMGVAAPSTGVDNYQLERQANALEDIQMGQFRDYIERTSPDR